MDNGLGKRNRSYFTTSLGRVKLAKLVGGDPKGEKEGSERGWGFLDRKREGDDGEAIFSRTVPDSAMKGTKNAGGKWHYSGAREDPLGLTRWDEPEE